MEPVGRQSMQCTDRHTAMADGNGKDLNGLRGNEQFTFEYGSIWVEYVSKESLSPAIHYGGEKHPFDM
jgi:hypothetical protein